MRCVRGNEETHRHPPLKIKSIKHFNNDSGHPEKGGRYCVITKVKASVINRHLPTKCRWLILSYTQVSLKIIDPPPQSGSGSTRVSLTVCQVVTDGLLQRNRPSITTQLTVYYNALNIKSLQMPHYVMRLIASCETTESLKKAISILSYKQTITQNMFPLNKKQKRACRKVACPLVWFISDRYGFIYRQSLRRCRGVRW